MTDDTIPSLVRQADAAAARRDLATAVVVLRHIAALQPDDAATWKKLAAISRAMARPDEARDAIDRALAIHPRDALALLLKAGLVEDAGGDAEEPYRAALTFIEGADRASPSLRARIEHARLYCATAHDRRIARLSHIARGESDALACSATERARIDAFVQTLADAASPVLPMLSRIAYHEPSRFAGLERVAAAHAVYMAEYVRLIASDEAAARPYVDHPADVPLDQWADLNRSRKWSAAHIWRGGTLVRQAADRCPKTLAAFAGLPTPDIPGKSPNLMYSILAPGTHIPPHVGVTNVRLVVHIPLRIPAACSLTVGGVQRRWVPGEAIVFDDTIEHEAINESDEVRVVLIGDVWHPDLSGNERKVLRALMD